MHMSLQGQTILVTGASGGIGAAIVERLAGEGARPIIHYGRDATGAEALLARTGGNGLLVQADLSTPDGPFALWQKALDAAGRIHGLVNNAGIRTEISIAASPEDWISVPAGNSICCSSRPTFALAGPSSAPSARLAEMVVR